MTLTLTPVDRWAGEGPGFNRAAAETVYKAMMDLPDDDTAAIYGRLLVEGLVQHELVTKGYELARAGDEIAKARGATMRRSLARSVVRKNARGEDATAELASLSVLIKALDFTEDERASYARKQQRDLHSGRFVREKVKIGYDSKLKPLDQNHAAQFDIQQHPALKGEDLARYQQAYGQLHAMISPFTKMGDHALVHLHIHDQDGPKRIETMRVNAKGTSDDLRAHVGHGEFLHSASVSSVPPTTAAGAAFDAMAPLSPTAAGIAYNSVEHGIGNTEALHEFRETTERNAEQDDYIPSQRIFRNIAGGSKLLSDSLGDAAPRQMKYALAVGQHVGRYGPEAQKVIGPTADRAAYRFRGSERPISEALRNSLTQLKNTPGIADKRWYLLHGNAKADGTVAGGGSWQPSSTLAYFRTQLPEANLSTLHLKSGAVPPSRGIVLDKHGQVSVEAVGYGDDHYVPFNLRGKSFRGLKGGEYIRTRTFGGPTTEDIYTGLMSGAKGIAVVSHNGVYTIDFPPDLKGGRRFNDNAARMVGRYGHLLDAVRSGQVETGGIAPSRLAELRIKADSIYPESTHPERYQGELVRLKEAEKKHPQLSEQQKAKATIDFFSEQTPGGRGTGDARQTMVAAYVHDEAAHRWQAANDRVSEDRRRYPGTAAEHAVPPSLEHFQSQVRDELSNASLPEIGAKYAEILEVKPQLDAYIKAAEQENAAGLQPLRLNGEGYKKALDALKEEFPHYVSDVQFHPWGSPRGPLDTGYVRPKHNRAAEALAGYFDTRVSRTGAGKVYADSTRWQNGRRSPIAVKDQARPAAGATAGATAAPTVDPGTAEAMRSQADKRLLHAYAGATHIGPEAVNSALDDPNALRGHGISELVGNANAPQLMGTQAPNLFQLFKLTPEQAEAAYAEDPAKMRGVLAGARAENAKLKWVDVPSDIEATFERGGKPAPPKTLGEHASTGLDNPHAERDFGDGVPAYEPDMRQGTARIQAAYEDHRAIGNLVRSGDLPEQVGDPDFETKAGAVVSALKTRRDAILSRANRDGIIPSSSDWASVDVPSEGILRALQLRRRHDQAVSAELGEAAPRADAVSTNTVEYNLPPRQEWESPEDYAKTQAAFLMEQARRQTANDEQGYRNSRTIES